jgi:hypothetical protein
MAEETEAVDEGKEATQFQILSLKEQVQLELLRLEQSEEDEKHDNDNDYEISSDLFVFI